MRTVKGSLIAAIILIAGTAAGTGTASAHAFPVRETPPPGAVLKTAPTAVVIAFTEAVNAHFSGISVKGPFGMRVDDGQTVRDPRNHKVLSVGIDVRLKAGKYRVTWHALATDGHRTQGSYDFVVAP